MRRIDREVSAFADKLSILNRCEIIRIGFPASPAPYIVPLHFGISVKGDTLTVYVHSALEGRKISLLEDGMTVAFEADRLISTNGDSSGLACIWSANYESVMGIGTLRHVVEEEEKRTGLDALMSRYGFEGKPQYLPAHLNAVAVMALEVTELTGKAKYKD